jgi:RNA 2',3'-cyclic 3'-phosphodiesterase
VRLFLAINLDVETRRAMFAAAEPLRTVAPELAWTRDDKLHLTLKFLGEQPDAAAATLGSALDNVAARHRPFTVSVRHVGAFPNFRRARVVWMGVDPGPRLELLHHDVEVACEELGFALEGRAFRPHITLARVRRPLPEPRLRQLARAAKKVDFAGEFDVGSIDIMQSSLGSARESGGAAGTGSSIYTRLHAAPLRSAS